MEYVVKLYCFELCQYLISSWKEPAREDLTTQQYFEDFRIDQMTGSTCTVDWVTTDEDFPELRGSLEGATG